MVTQGLHALYLLLLGVLFHAAINVFDILDLGPLLLQYSLFMFFFCVCGFSCDNVILRDQEVSLLPPRPPRPRGYYARRRKHHHYFRRKFRSSVITLVQLHSLDDFNTLSDNLLSSAEVSQFDLDRVASTMHKILHLSWITIDLSFNINLSNFVRSIDPLRTFCLLKLLHSKPFFQHSVNKNPVTKATSLQCVSTMHSNPVQDPSILFAAGLLKSPMTFNDTVSDPFSFLN
jgi:hypothetical protein